MAESTTSKPGVINWALADHFLNLLGKNGDARLRAFPHKETPEEVRNRLGARKIQRDRSQVQQAQVAGLGVYVVINNGGDTKASIVSCPAYFAEFDGLNEDEQKRKVSSSGLPKPSLVVRTGGGSLHFYWLLDQPFKDPAQWQLDQKRLAAHLGSDPSINDPSRVMRLPGCWYMGADQKPVALVEIAYGPGVRYSRGQIVACLPPEPVAAPLLATAATKPAAPPAAVPRGMRVPLEEFITKAHAELIQQGSAKGANNDDGLELALDLVGCEEWLQARGVTAEPSARDLFEAYINQSAANFGRGFDRKAALDRFEGAPTKTTGPSTPELKLEDRLTYHRRQSLRSTGVAAPGFPKSGDQLPSAGTPLGEKAEQVGSPPIDKWESAIRSMLNPEHPNHEKNTIRRQIRAATLAAELSLRVSPAQARQRILQIQRAMLTGGASKGTAGGERARITEKEWLVDGLIAKGCLTGIAAFNKVGKTKMAARLAADLIFGRPFLGRFPVAPGHHRIVLWWVDQPAADSAAYLRAVGLMKPDGTLHPQIVSLYTEEDDLAWDDAGADLLLEHAGKEPGLVLITDSFFHSIQRIYGSDQEPEAGGALIDIQTLLAPYGVTHICLFHSPKDTGPNGIQAIRGHGSAGGAVSACISLHFMEKRCPMKKIWIADKDNPHRRMVVEGRAPFQDLLIRGDWAAGTFKVIGEYQKAIAQLLADEGKARAVDGLTDAHRQVLEVIGGTSGVDGATLLQIAQGVHGTSEPTHSQKETIRHQCLAMVKDGLLRKRDLHGRTFFSVAPGVLTG
jgi:hypothetical protein